MNKKLPKVFPGQISKTTNKTYSYTTEEEKVEKKEKIDERTIEQKLDAIFNSPTYIYKADVTIITKEKEMTKRIIGKNKNNLITFDNELIPIDEIIDIKQK